MLYIISYFVVCSVLLLLVLLKLSFILAFSFSFMFVLYVSLCVSYVGRSR